MDKEGSLETQDFYTHPLLRQIIFSGRGLRPPALYFDCQFYSNSFKLCITLNRYYEYASVQKCFQRINKELTFYLTDMKSQ